jgi:hypothetical protein
VAGLVYLVYSYVLYAFCVHFGALFLVYLAALGLSFYALAGSVVTMNVCELAERLNSARTRAMSALLLSVGVLFALLWLSDVGRALVAGTEPPSVGDVGLPVNPIHVLDLAFLLPALILTAVLLRRRNPYGLVYAAPLGIFLIGMGIAIMSMVIVMRGRGVPVPLAMPAVVAVIVIVAAAVTLGYLRDAAPSTD